MKDHILLSKIGSKNWQTLIVPRVVFASLRYLRDMRLHSKAIRDQFQALSVSGLKRAEVDIDIAENSFNAL